MNLETIDEFEINIYQPNTVAIGNDGGDLVFLMKQEKETKKRNENCLSSRCK